MIIFYLIKCEINTYIIKTEFGLLKSSKLEMELKPATFLLAVSTLTITIWRIFCLKNIFIFYIKKRQVFFKIKYQVRYGTEICHLSISG